MELILAKEIVVSETAKHRHLVEEYCVGNGVDLGSGGDPVVPWAIQVDLPSGEFYSYNPDRSIDNIQWKGYANDLPFKDHTLDFVHASHLIEDFADWGPILSEWDRVLKQGGYLIIAVPDHERFRAAVVNGQGDNLSHKHEGRVGELSELLYTYETIRDDFVSVDTNEYSILYIGRKR
jgi:SAM-dependent methyltransferase